MLGINPRAAGSRTPRNTATTKNAPTSTNDPEVGIGAVTTLTGVVFGVALTDSAATFRALFTSQAKGGVVFALLIFAVLLLGTSVLKGLLQKHKSSKLGLSESRRWYQLFPAVSVGGLLVGYFLGFGVLPYLQKGVFPWEAYVGLAAILAWLVSMASFLWDFEGRFRAL